jgi:hypothetical protein
MFAAMLTDASVYVVEDSLYQVRGLHTSHFGGHVQDWQVKPCYFKSISYLFYVVTRYVWSHANWC